MIVALPEGEDVVDVQTMEDDHVVSNVGGLDTVVNIVGGLDTVHIDVGTSLANHSGLILLQRQLLLHLLMSRLLPFHRLTTSDS